MKQGHFYGLTFLVVLIVLAGIVFAITDIRVEEEKFRATYPVEAGWNLLPSHDFSEWQLAAYPQKEVPPTAEWEAYQNNLLAKYLYLPRSQRFVNTMTTLSDTDLRDAQSNEDFLSSSGAWYYFNEAMELSFLADKEMTIVLDKGWNLFVVPPHLNLVGNPDLGNTFPIGDCVVEKLYLWEAISQEWTNLENAVDELVEEDAAGLGFAVKIASKCTLGSPDAPSEISPPVLPE